MSDMTADCPQIIRNIRSLKGGSQPILAEASDGRIYVIKFTERLKRPNLAFNESMGTELYRACGLPVAPWKPLRLSDSFINQTPNSWPHTPSGRQRPEAGVYFGSRFLGTNTYRLFEILPGSYFPRVTNAADFWLAWMLDVCSDHAHSRQAVFSEFTSGCWEAIFIGFSHMFGGTTGRESVRNFRVSQYRDARIYPAISPRLLLTILGKLDNLNCDYVWRQLAGLPEEWKTASSVRNLTACLDRLSNCSFLAKILGAMAKYHKLRQNDSPNYKKGRDVRFLCSRVQSLPRGRRVAG